MPKKLFIPGPVDVSPDVLEQLKHPMIGHRFQECSALQESCVKNLKRLMFTDNEIIISTSSSSGLMEGAIRNSVSKKCLIFSCGAFGDRWHDIAKSCGKEAEKVEVSPGEAITPELVGESLAKDNYDAITVTHNETSMGVTNPVSEIGQLLKENYPDICFLVDSVSGMGGIKLEVDNSAIDVCIFGTQKALALPPGLAICSVSEKVIKKAETIPHRGWYFDFLNLLKYARKFQYPSTPAISLMYTLDYQLKKILDEEGLENRFKRHQELGEMAREWVKKSGFELLPREEYASNTVTCVKNTKGIDILELKQKLGEKGYAFATGYGKVKETTFRIGHMGDRTLEELKEYLDTIDEVLGL